MTLYDKGIRLSTIVDIIVTTTIDNAREYLRRKDFNEQEIEQIIDAATKELWN